MQQQNDKKLSIARKLKELREQQNLTQADVGRLIGRAFTTVASWESGKGQPDIDTLFTLLRLYKIENVLEEFGYAEQAPFFSRQERQHIDQLRTLGEQAQQLVLDMTRRLADMETAKQWIPAVARNGQGEGILISSTLCTLDDEGWQGEDKT